MKANTPSLILYFLSLTFAIIFDFLEEDFIGMYAKAIVVPSIFIYYLITTNYKINLIQGLIFALCFTGEVFSLMEVDATEFGSLFCFLSVYLLFLKLIFDDNRKIKLRKNDILPVAIVVLFILYLLISVLGLQYEKIKEYHFIYTVYGIVLSMLGCISFISYISKGTYLTLLLTIMTACFIFSDVFFIFNQSFDHSIVLVLIRDVTQMLAYYFMVRYFIQKRIENIRVRN
ncbi:lysoplasmalogenase family protein [Flavobacterium branchiarum]|uniref:Lysoplasmalogenase family protein n=1 Tax=Flavobacterium branchiarum TaxID=1114870 RepID=A0ABV5FI27_9FLAO|nr:lysoplasmalogenase family protein [Flavobacterium branchiarum]MDN3673739.1 lysoplasmalogenase family protein [Flavobacterium branchiarum]MDN3673768.1 lysoplasmalogenase family protein [Flavobacterium branchiarum]MDN3673782.1 lysoplasmalogenase family protein [Flavobacterium branchiarum]